MNDSRYDVVVIGGGSGGYAAARTARALGASVAIVDHGPLGGLCILRGCMPSKTLLATSDLLHDVRAGAALGVHASDVRLDMRHVIERKRAVIEDFASYRREQLRAFPIYEDHASFVDATHLRVGPSTVLEARAFIVATGSVIAPPPIPGLAEAGSVDSDVILDRASLPESAIVLGGGYVGCELGQFLARAGVATTFLIRAPHLLSNEDADVGEALTASFRAEGIEVRSECVFSNVEVRAGRKLVHTKRGDANDTFEAEEIFNALGRVPNTSGLELDRAGIAHHPITGIDVGPDLRTSVPNVFAIGDVNGAYPLVHVAIYQGELAARNAVLGESEPADYRLQRTHAVFTDPQVATTGPTEKELRRSGTPYLAASYPFADHGKAIAIAKTAGFVKILASPEDGEILGAAVVGANASDLIHEMIVAMHFRANVVDFSRIPHLHPTLAEIWTYPAEELAERLHVPLPERTVVAR